MCKIIHMEEQKKNHYCATGYDSVVPMVGWDLLCDKFVSELVKPYSTLPNNAMD